VTILPRTDLWADSGILRSAEANTTQRPEHSDIRSSWQRMSRMNIENEANARSKRLAGSYSCQWDLATVMLDIPSRAARADSSSSMGPDPSRATMPLHIFATGIDRRPHPQPMSMQKSFSDGSRTDSCHRVMSAPKPLFSRRLPTLSSQNPLLSRSLRVVPSSSSIQVSSQSIDSPFSDKGRGPGPPRFHQTLG